MIDLAVVEICGDRELYYGKANVGDMVLVESGGEYVETEVITTGSVERGSEIADVINELYHSPLKPIVCNLSKLNLRIEKLGGNHVYND